MVPKSVSPMSPLLPLLLELNWVNQHSICFPHLFIQILFWCSLVILCIVVLLRKKATSLEKPYWRVHAINFFYYSFLKRANEKENESQDNIQMLNKTIGESVWVYKKGHWSERSFLGQSGKGTRPLRIRRDHENGKNIKHVLLLLCTPAGHSGVFPLGTGRLEA